jgi:hypothetical protein
LEDYEMKKVLPLKAFLVIGIFSIALVPLASAGVGQALYERWNGGGYDADGAGAESMLTESSTPVYTEIITSAEWGVGDNDSIEDYRARITAWLIPPVTGEYIFWLVTDDAGRLWLSTDDDPANAQLIAQETEYAGEDGWGEIGDETQSAAITLERGKAYWLRGGYQEGGGGDHIRIGWASAEAGIADHTVIKGQYLSDTNPFCASNINPADGAINVHLDTILSFNTGLAVPDDPNAPLTANPDITTHFVYMCKDDPEDPNLTLALAATLDVGTTSYDPEGQFELQRESVYRWRVDEGLGTDPNPDDPNAVITGPIWSFSTVGYTPYFNPDLPADAIVDAGEDVTFRVEATNPYTYDNTGLSYQWYKAAAGDPEGSPLACTEPTLVISDVQIADEGDYFCRVTIDDHPEDFADSARAALAVKRLLAHWPFDNDPNSNDPNISGITEDIIGDADGVIIGNVVSGTGVIGNAFYFDAAEQMRVEIPTETINRRNWTLSCWIKIPADNINETYNDIISNGPDRGYPYGNFYLAAWPYPDEDEIVEFISVINNEGGEWSKILPKEVWQHFAVVYDTRTESHSYYINGGRMDEEDKSANPFTGFGPILSIGADADDAYSYPYTGWVDDLRMYSYPLEQQEITELYLEGAGTEEVCLAHWPLDNEPDNTDPNTSGIVEDVIGDADGVVVGDVEWGPGLAGNAAFFDGKKTRIELPTRTINRTSWSISFWVNVPTSHVKEDYNDIISNGPYREDPWVYLYISGSIYPDEADFCSAINNAGDIWSWYYEKETWHHLVTTYDPRTMTHTFYVNGAKIGDDFDMSRDPFLGFGPLISIGADADDAFSYPYSGWVDEVRFYSYPLRHSEVLDLYMTGLNLDEACINWEMPFYDMNDDCKIDIEDFSYMASVFSTDDEQADFSGNDIVDLADLVELAGMWLECGIYPTCAEPEL